MAYREVDKKVLGLLIVIIKTPIRLRLSIKSRDERGLFIA